MRRRASSTCGLAWPLALLVWPVCCVSPSRGAAEATLKVEALLVWSTNDEKSPDPKLKKVPEEMRKKLRAQPFKWTNYFVVKRVTIEVPNKGTVKTAMSEKCEVQVKHLGDTTLEVSLFGKREHVLKRTQPLPTGETLILGGNAPNATGWFVVLQQPE